MFVIIEGARCGVCGWRMQYHAPEHVAAIDDIDARWMECPNSGCKEYHKPQSLPKIWVMERA